MSASDHISALKPTTAITPPTGAPAGAPATVGAPAGGAPARRLALARAPWRYAGFAGVLALSVVLGTHRLSQNGYANTFYSAGVKSMLSSWHNFLFASFDPGGLVSIDKPPLGVWAQAASAEVFGFSPLSLLLPEAIFATVAVAVLYRVLARRLGAGAGLAGALALAVFPSFVAISRDNGVDPLLILLMLLACAAALNAIEDGRARWLLCSAALVALAFNTKTLAAFLVVPGILTAYLLCAPGSLRRRCALLAAALAVIGIGSFAWIALVELTPSAQRPYVGSSTDDTELGLTFSYNGFGRVEGEQGGPGQVPRAEGALVRVVSHRPHGRLTRAQARLHAQRLRALRLRELRLRSPVLPDGRLRNPITFGGATGPLRLFEAKLADQGAWVLPFALVGMLAFASLLLARREGGSRRREERFALLLVLGGWLLCEMAILSFSKGIVHPYYISAVGPGAAAMIAAGAAAFAGSAARRDPRVLLLPCAVAATVGVQVAILHHQGYMRWWVPALIVASAAGVALALASRRAAPPAIAGVVGVLLVAPCAYASTTWLAPVQGTFPAAGPHQATGSGEYGVNARALRVDRNLIAYVTSHHPGTRWAALTVAAPTAAPMMLLGLPAGAIAGYSGTDPALDGAGLARLVARGWARYVVLGGAYASRGGNLASKAVLRSCPQVPADAWHGPVPSPYELVLFDCAGRARALPAPLPAAAARARALSAPLPAAAGRTGALSAPLPAAAGRTGALSASLPAAAARARARR
jgi:4-amino-4-deoxy-L-arabinose transferase-like glycosyltransferase